MPLSTSLYPLLLHLPFSFQNHKHTSIVPRALRIGKVVCATLSVVIAGASIPLHAEPEADGETVAPPPESSALPAQVMPVTLSAPVTPAAPPKQMEVDVPAIRAKYPNLLKIQHFSTVDVVIIGSKARLGLKDPTVELQDFATYCFGQLFKGYDIQPLPSGPQVGKASEYGTLNITINTYAIGMSCELRMGTVGSENTWVTNELRVSSANAIKDARLLKTTIAQMIAKGAYTLRKTQGR